MVEVVISGWLIGIAIALPVGPVITELIRRALSGGFLHGWLVGLGAAASHAILVTLTLLGVVTLFDRPLWHVFLGLGGVVVLGYLGLGAFRSGITPPTLEASRSTGHPFLVGFGIGIANPITLLWFLTVGGGLIVAQAQPAGRVSGGGTAGLAVAFGASFVIGVLCWDSVVAAMAAAGRRWMGPRTLWTLNAAAGLVFFGFALRLAWKLLQIFG
jgi:threonine/homoserine/homoserine lactone efflux protein